MLTYEQQEKVADKVNNKYGLPGYPVILAIDVPYDLDFENITPNQELLIIQRAAMQSFSNATNRGTSAKDIDFDVAYWGRHFIEVYFAKWVEINVE